MADHHPAEDSSSAPGYLVVARIAGAHGVQGDLRCALVTDFPSRFKPGLQVYLSDEHVSYEVERARVDRKRAVLKLIGVDSREAAEALRGTTVFVAETDAVRLPRGTYFWHQIIGLRVVTTAEEVLGSVADIIETGANDVYVVRKDPPEVGELLIPAIKDVVKKIDLKAGQITVELLEGLA